MSAATPPPAGGTPDPYASPDAGATPRPGPAPTDPPAPYAQAPGPATPYDQGPDAQGPHGGPATPYAQPTPYDAQGAYPYAQRPPGTDGFSITALVTGILGIGPVALGFGIAGLRRTRRTGRDGQGLAIAGIVLGALGILGGLIFAGLVVLAMTSEDLQEGFSEGFQESFADQTGANLQLGDCFELPADSTDLTGIVAIDCASAHGAELVGVDELTDTEYPGEDSVVATTQEFCYAQFADYVGTDYDSSGLDMMYLYPTQASWTFGDRRLLCWAQNPDGSPLEGSVQGSGL
ncbi:DUF4190 domain-containing protein [Krasilnikoviella flava]|uniref:Septum formation n=1 Tax=Krasilnikoviella flava TaxID=526729 RepID=A0A1T5LJU6_9MICO|nr:DUF4190 domain-containing protein [Krasilnikoviella flava]SKC75919.1 protein of unknown function [Krasilnikoviella flava]